jgi:hypothetical protein
VRLSIRSAGGAIAVLLVLCATACGGSGSKSGSGTTAATTPAVTTTTAAPATTYTLANTRKCLDASAGIHAYLNNKNTIVNGTGGELRVDFGYGFQWIYIAFGKDTSEAKAIEQHAVAATLKHDDKLDRKTVVSGVRRKGNVFYYADGGPVTEVEGSQVDACLK